MIALTLACAVACAALVVAEHRGARAARIATKLIAAAAFVGVGALAQAQPIDPGFARIVLVGLILGAVGDGCLLGHGTRWFLAGLVAFLLGHLAYVVAIATLEPAGRWPADAGALAAAPIAVAGVALARLWPRLGRLRGAVIGYVAAITAMVIAAVAAWRADALPAPQAGRLALGAALFFASDLAVARDRFVGKQFVNKAWGLPTYFAGQLLFAWAIAR